MTQHSDIVRLKHMLGYAKEAISIARGGTSHELQKNRMLQLSLLHLVELVGEAAARISKQTRERHPEINWKEIVGMRNKIIHDYVVTDLEILWGTVKKDLPVLASALEKIISESQS